MRLNQPESMTMGEYAEYELEKAFMRGVTPKMSPVQHFDKIKCPLCGKLYGGAGINQFDGVRSHLKYKHGVTRKKDQKQMLGICGSEAEA